MTQIIDALEAAQGALLAWQNCFSNSARTDNALAKIDAALAAAREQQPDRIHRGEINGPLSSVNNGPEAWPTRSRAQAGERPAAPPAPSDEQQPVAWQLLEDLNLASLERVAAEKEAQGEERIPCFLSVEWVKRAVAAWRAAPLAPDAESSTFDLPSILDAVEFRRDQYGWTQKQMAEALGMADSHYSEFVNGKRNLPFRAICRAYSIGVPADVLLQDAARGSEHVR